MTENEERVSLVIRRVLDRALSKTDTHILEAVLAYNQEEKARPTASEIQSRLARTRALKKSQLYERLGYLSTVGFLRARPFPRPRQYEADEMTILMGMRNWLERKRERVAEMARQFESMNESLNTVTHEELADIIDLDCSG